MYELPNFRHLYYFWTIAREGSIKKAGAKLNLTPSGLSEQLRLLEEYFGKQLFERKTRKLILNDTGKIVFERCTNIFNQTEDMSLTVKQKVPQRRTRIRVGVLPSLSSSHIHEFVVPLLKDKSVSVVVIENPLDELIYQLDQGALEIVLSDRAVEKKFRKITSYRLKPRKIIVVATPKFAHLKKKFPHSLSGAPIMQLTRHSQIRDEIDRYFTKHQINPQIIGEADDVTLLRLGAEKGLCVAVLPQNTVNEALSQKKLIKLGELSGVNSDMWAMARSDSSRMSIISKTIQRFISIK
ncbi:MAG: LysR family transcriptional regulator [Candidatus Nitrohelix vancouverensis]|uniref:LysR family transcriptional regulator n=1 Tax=Candidatus Nitrohelix vancouverensis TaxID=2705534 RepID=A0A7T0C0Q6_9BACT|nr:MAG: LysR family transcriptional regulator [Candidatus Nitrohelix vancouverensis]